MTLDLSPEQPPEPTEIPAEAPRISPAPAVVATLVTTDGVVVRLSETPDGGVTLAPAGNRASLSFDRFQAAALRSAMSVED
jgi:hypothetical protein